MKSHRFLLPVVILLCTMAFAQSDIGILNAGIIPVLPFFGDDSFPTSGEAGMANKSNSQSASGPSVAQSEAHKMDAPKTAAPKSQAQASFDNIKTLAGDWEGPVNTDMSPEMVKATGGGIKPIHVSMRVTSRGNVLVEEFQEAGTPLDATKFDHPVTMFYVDADQLNLVHYCDAGNRPRMTSSKISPDGKRMEFEFADLSGSNKTGHMHHAIFNIIDANHHTEEWTYMMPGDRPIHATFDLQRAK